MVALFMVCPVCGENFVAGRANARYCSAVCRRRRERNLARLRALADAKQHARQALKHARLRGDQIVIVGWREELSRIDAEIAWRLAENSRGTPVPE